jgi:hypothetical protein
VNGFQATAQSPTWRARGYFPRTFLLCSQLPKSRVRLEKLRVRSASQEIRHLFLSRARWIQSTPSNLSSLRSILLFSSHLRVGLASGLFHYSFPAILHARYMPPNLILRLFSRWLHLVFELSYLRLSVPITLSGTQFEFRCCMCGIRSSRLVSPDMTGWSLAAGLDVCKGVRQRAKACSVLYGRCTFLLATAGFPCLLSSEQYCVKMVFAEHWALCSLLSGACRLFLMVWQVFVFFRFLCFVPKLPAANSCPVEWSSDFVLKTARSMLMFPCGTVLRRTAVPDVGLQAFIVNRTVNSRKLIFLNVRSLPPFCSFI